MKTTSNTPRRFLTALITTCLAVLAPALTHAQEEPKSKYGFIRLVNTVAPGTGPLTLIIDGENPRPQGYKLGNVTGGIALKPGAHEIVIRREGVKEGTTRVNIEKDETTTLIPFAERVPASDEEPAHWAIRILRLKQQDPDTQRTASFVSVSREPEWRIEIREPAGTWTAVYVKRLGVTRTPILYPEGYAPLRHKDGKLPSIPIAEPGNYVVVLYDDENGKLQSLNLQDHRYLSAD